MRNTCHGTAQDRMVKLNQLTVLLGLYVGVDCFSALICKTPDIHSRDLLYSAYTNRSVGIRSAKLLYIPPVSVIPLIVLVSTVQ